MDHSALAHLTISPSGRRYAASLRRLRDDLRPGAPARVVTAPIARGLRLLGLDVVRRDGIALIDYLLRRGLAAGGADMADYLEGEIVDHVFRNTAIFAAPANLYVALYTTATTDAGGGTEVSGGGYARVAVGTTSGWSGAGGAGATDNAADIDFGAATANWGTITHMGLRDSAAGGNLLVHGALTASKTVNDGDSFKFAIGDLDMSFD